MKIPEKYQKVRDVSITKQELIDFESKVRDTYEAGKIKGPIHLAKNNEDQLIEIFQYISKDDWVFVPWRNHYQALLHGVDKDKLFESICNGVAMSLKRKNKTNRVWCFVGDMTMETGVFHEAYKYAKNFDLPLEWVIEDNNMSVHTPTDMAWNKKMQIPNDVISYSYEMGYPHHGTGNWVNF